MLQRASAGLIAILVLAGCAEPGIAEPTPQPVLLAGRWISFMVENAGEPDHHLAVVDDRDLTRIVGIVHPATIPGDTTLRVRVFVPDDIPWMISSNDLLLVTAGDVQGFCGALPIRMHLNWGAGSVEVPIWLGEAVGFPDRPPDNCDPSDREVLQLPPS